MKNVTISLSDSLLGKSREYARARGKSFNELVREVLAREVGDESDEAIRAAFTEADALALRLTGPIPTREERNAR